MKTRGDSLPNKLRAYFAANPDEELTLSDICTKFGYSMKTVDASLRRMRNAGYPIETVHVVRIKTNPGA